MSLKEIKATQISALNENVADKETRIQILNTWINELSTKPLLNCHCISF